MNAAEQLVPSMGVALVCAGLGVSRASYYRKQKSKQEPEPKPKPVRALSDEERQQVLELLHSDRFVDQSPQEVSYARNWCMTKGEERAYPAG